MEIADLGHDRVLTHLISATLPPLHKRPARVALREFDETLIDVKEQRVVSKETSATYSFEFIGER